MNEVWGISNKLTNRLQKHQDYDVASAARRMVQLVLSMREIKACTINDEDNDADSEVVSVTLHAQPPRSKEETPDAAAAPMCRRTQRDANRESRFSPPLLRLASPTSSSSSSPSPSPPSSSSRKRNHSSRCRSRSVSPRSSHKRSRRPAHGIIVLLSIDGILY